jgi:8-oxo-dGTP pyrophosphatase MutT (NUDIX family)
VVATREYSAGGVVVREHEGRLEVAVIRPRGRSVTALPKGHIERGETSQMAAEREIFEETGLRVTCQCKLGDVKYVFRFRGKTIFKCVGFYLFRWAGGEVDVISEKMREEVDEAKWIRLADAPQLLSYPGEREMAAKALRLLEPSPPTEADGSGI